MKLRTPIAVGLLTGAALACRQEPSATEPIATARTVTAPAPRPDLTATSVSPHYDGDDPEAAYAALENSAKTATKGEYETSLEYTQRMTAARSEATKHVFTLYAGHGPMEYNADSQVLRKHVYFFEPTWLVTRDELINPSSTKRASLALKKVRSDDGSYIGTNAFDAKVKIARVVEHEWEMVFDKPSGLKDDSVAPELEVVLTVAPARARELKEGGRLRLLIWCMVGSRSIRKSGPSQPTISAPTEKTTITKYLHGAINELWAFDEQTGEVLYKHVFKKIPQDGAPAATKPRRTVR